MIGVSSLIAVDCWPKTLNDRTSTRGLHRPGLVLPIIGLWSLSRPSELTPHILYQNRTQARTTGSLARAWPTSWSDVHSQSGPVRSHHQNIIPSSNWLGTMASICKHAAMTSWGWATFKMNRIDHINHEYKWLSRCWKEKSTLYMSMIKLHEHVQAQSLSLVGGG